MKKKCYFCKSIWKIDRLIPFKNGRVVRGQLISHCCPVCIKTKDIDSVADENKQRDVAHYKVYKFKKKHDIKELPTELKKAVFKTGLLNEKSKRLK